MPIIMIEQAFNSLSYYRRRNVMMAVLGDKKKVKDMMLENKGIIQENTSKCLFRKKFDEKITECVKAKKKAREFFNIIDNKQSNNLNNNQPF